MSGASPAPQAQGFDIFSTYSRILEDDEVRLSFACGASAAPFLRFCQKTNSHFSCGIVLADVTTFGGDIISHGPDGTFVWYCHLHTPKFCPISYPKPIAKPGQCSSS